MQQPFASSDLSTARRPSCSRELSAASRARISRVPRQTHPPGHTATLTGATTSELCATLGKGLDHEHRLDALQRPRLLAPLLSRHRLQPSALFAALERPRPPPPTDSPVPSLPPAPDPVNHGGDLRPHTRRRQRSRGKAARRQLKAEDLFGRAAKVHTPLTVLPRTLRGRARERHARLTVLLQIHWRLRSRRRALFPPRSAAGAHAEPGYVLPF